MPADGGPVATEEGDEGGSTGPRLRRAGGPHWLAIGGRLVTGRVVSASPRRPENLTTCPARESPHCLLRLVDLQARRRPNPGLGVGALSSTNPGHWRGRTRLNPGRTGSISALAEPTLHALTRPQGHRGQALGSNGLSLDGRNGASRLPGGVQAQRQLTRLMSPCRGPQQCRQPARLCVLGVSDRREECHCADSDDSTRRGSVRVE